MCLRCPSRGVITAFAFTWGAGEAGPALALQPSACLPFGDVGQQQWAEGWKGPCCAACLQGIEKHTLQLLSTSPVVILEHVMRCGHKGDFPWVQMPGPGNNVEIFFVSVHPHTEWGERSAHASSRSSLLRHETLS